MGDRVGVVLSAGPRGLRRPRMSLRGQDAVSDGAAGVLQAGNVKVYKQTWGTVRDAIEQFKSGRLKELADAGNPGP